MQLFASIILFLYAITCIHTVLSEFWCGSFFGILPTKSSLWLRLPSPILATRKAPSQARCDVLFRSNANERWGPWSGRNLLRSRQDIHRLHDASLWSTKKSPLYSGAHWDLSTALAYPLVSCDENVGSRIWIKTFPLPHLSSPYNLLSCLKLPMHTINTSGHSIVSKQCHSLNCYRRHWIPRCTRWNATSYQPTCNHQPEKDPISNGLPSWN